MKDLSTKKKERYERRLWHCYVSYEDVGDAIWAKHDGKHAYNSRLFTETRKERYERRLWHCYVSFGDVGDAIWAKHTASMPIITDFSKKQRKMQMTRLSRRRSWRCYVSFGDVGDSLSLTYELDLYLSRTHGVTRSCMRRDSLSLTYELDMYLSRTHGVTRSCMRRDAIC